MGHRRGAPPARQPPLRAYEEVLEWIEGQILGGDLPTGARLPAERDLASQIGVSRAAVREAIRTLQAQGIVRSAVGAGDTGGTTITAVDGGALSRMLRLHVALGHFPLPHVIEVRITLEQLSARLACERREDSHLEELNALVRAMESSQDDRERFNDLDTRFHVALAAAAGNRLATGTTAALRESMRLPILERFRRTDTWPALVPQLVEDHRAILQAVRTQDAERAASLVAEHIRSAWRVLDG
ncbi:transcriptional regulator, GntR family [Kytococcus aerolatus]|uniref:Transcriptional regulator, GntR family n=1 Tax=Kytococcus aerolatus TaxID=592308 RepID=A0A212U647_9MICO|nr:transcriptional regulator, GntR family [Kytococcus aerolatus]